MSINLEWWMYVALTISAFIGCLILNYIVKVINDAKLEDRYIRIRQKTSTNQGTQVHCPLAEITARTTRVPLDNMLEKQNTTPNKISLVFNREDNLHENKRLADISDSEDGAPSLKLISTNTSGTKSCESIAKPILLGHIYSNIIPDNDKKVVLQPEDEDLVAGNNVNECKSDINLSDQNYQELKEWIVGLLTKITNDE